MADGLTTGPGPTQFGVALNRILKGSFFFALKSTTHPPISFVFALPQYIFVLSL